MRVKNHWIKRSSITSLIVFFFSSYFFISNASAVTFTVDSTIDDYDLVPGDGICAAFANRCTLRAAIMETSALPNAVVNGVEVADVINIPDGTYKLYIRNVNSVPEDLGATGDLDINDSVIITGNTANKNAVIIDAGSTATYTSSRDRVFHILSSEKLIKVEFNYLVISGGYLSDTRGGGGGICIACVGSNSEAYLPTGLGTQTPDINTTFDPALYSGGGNLPRPEVILRFVDLINNIDSISGAGIMNSGILTIEDSLLQNNRTSYVFGDRSGQNGKFTNNSQFVGGGNGGAISNWGGKLTIRRTIIDGNRALTGGAIYSQAVLAQFRDEQVFIENTQITNNQAFMGGAIFNVSGDWNYPERALRDYGFVVSQSTIDGNRAEYSGGGIYNLGVAAMQLSNVTISNNLAQDAGNKMPNKGGGIYHSGKILDIVNTTISGNSAQDTATMGMASPDDATGGDEIFVDVTEANADPLSNLPWRLTLLNSIVGDVTSTDACNGTVGYDAFITDTGGNADDSNTCLAAPPIAKASTQNKTMSRSADTTINTSKGVVLGALANNGGIPGNELPDGTFPPTRALISGDAIGSGIDCNAKDQRGFGRLENVCDAGAFQTGSNTKGISTNVTTLPIARTDNIETALGVDVFVPLSTFLVNDNDPLLRGVVSFDKASVALVDESGLSVQVVKGQQANNTGSIYFVSFKTVTGFEGNTAFTYKVNVVDPDTELTIKSESAVVNVLVNPKNIAPFAYSQNFSVPLGSTFDSDLAGSLAADNKTILSYDPEGSVLTYYVDTPPATGTVTIDPDGSFSYASASNADTLGTDSFTYVVEDDQGLRSKPAAVAVYVTPLGLSSIGDVVANVEVGRIVSINLASNATGRFFFGLKRSASATQGEILWLNENTGELVYRANTLGDTSTSEVFEFTVIDLDANGSAGQTSVYEGSVTINLLEATTNTLPAANADALSIGSGIDSVIYLTATDPENDSLFYTITTPPSQGKITRFDPAVGSVTYKANDHATGTDEFRYSVSDGQLQSEIVTVSLTLAAKANIAPVANDDVAMTPNNLSISVNVLRNDSDENGDVLSLILDSSTSTQGGAIAVLGDGIIKYTPPAGFVGDDEVPYQVDDQFSGVATAKLKITVIEASAGDYEITKITQIQTQTDETAANETSKYKTERSGGFASISPLFMLFGLMLLLMRRNCRFR